MSNAEVKIQIVTRWTEWVDADFYLLKLRLDRIDGVGILYYLMNPRQAYRDLRLWFKFAGLVRKVKKDRAARYRTWFAKRQKAKKPSLFSRIKGWFSKKPDQQAEIKKEEQIDAEVEKQLSEALAKLTAKYMCETLEKETKEEQKPVDEKDKKE
jgi:hypothetical protein